MKSNSAIIYRMVLILGDWFALVAAFTVAYILRVRYDERALVAQIPAEAFLWAILTVLPLWILVHGAIGLYSKHVFDNRFAEFGRLLLGSFIGILVVIGYDFVVEDTMFPARLVVVYGFLLGLGFLISFRTIARTLRGTLFSYGFGVTNLVVVGSGSAAEGVIGQFAGAPKSGYRVVGTVGRSKSEDNIPNYKSLKDAEKALGRKNIHIDSIIQAELYQDDQKNSEVLSYAQSKHLDFRFIPSTSKLFSGNLAVELVREIPMLTVHQTALVGWGRIAKRLFDALFGGILFVLSLPLLLLASLAMKLANPREPLFFKQTRLTQYDRPFIVYKLRTQMSRYDGTSPEKAFKQMGRPELAKKYRENGDYIGDDPRLLKLGRLLRAASIDELPQLFNVVKGDISLVGPRALVPEELNSYRQKHHILSIKSGVTGLAQVSGRRNISFEERRKLDIYYVQNWSFWLDIIILLKTLRVVISGMGAK